ncbi:MAG: type II secretion system protein GspG [Lysobacter sp.]
MNAADHRVVAPRSGVRMRRGITRVTAVLAVLALVGWALSNVLFNGCTRTDHTVAQSQIQTLGAKIETFKGDTGRLPESLRELTWPNGLGPYARESEFVDPWQRPVYYRVIDDGKDCVVFSLGKDGRLGGEGQDADIQYTSPQVGS